jgi:hypothetical protein
MRATTLRALEGLPEAMLQRTVLGERLTQRSPEDAAALIDEILVGAAAGHEASRSGAVALALWILAEPEGSAVLVRIHEAATATSKIAVAAILGAGPARCALAKRGRLAEIGIAVEGPLGVSRRWPGDVARSLLRIQRLTNHHDPRMIRRLLEQRWIRRAHVVALAARRPTTPAIVRELCASPRWLLHAEVREALASNPFTPASVVLPLLPTLSRIHLRRLRAGAAGASVAAAAGHLLDLALPRERLP